MNAPSSTVEPAAVKKRFAGFGNNGEGAIKRLREIAKVREVIEQKYKAALAEAKKFQSECEDSWRAFLQNPFSVDLRKVALLRVEGEVAAEIFAHLYRRGTW